MSATCGRVNWVIVIHIAQRTGNLVIKDVLPLKTSTAKAKISYQYSLDRGIKVIITQMRMINCTFPYSLMLLNIQYTLSEISGRM